VTTILLYENDNGAGAIAAERLANAGFDLARTSDAFNALGCLRARIPPDLLIVTVALYHDGVNSLAFARLAQRISADLPVILLFETVMPWQNGTTIARDILKMPSKSSPLAQRVEDLLRSD
jgi:DNA-binding NtrC family response regulator